ncbi:MAG: L-glutamate gamma-semialdehyde dehydrogenase [Candidatus Sericytochromatia bacterium]|nr:L-glutamate gamma-semialdehyde dehydrogenase [Candidatus Sericytochromatia bacterium]
MTNGIFTVPEPHNEPVLTYAPGSSERTRLKAELDRQYQQQIEIPLIIGGKEIRTGRTATAVSPHDHQHVLATYHLAGPTEIRMAIDAALQARSRWAALPWNERAAVFVRMAELITTKYRYILNAATMLNQSKNAFQAEVDASCEFADFLRFNVAFMEQIYRDQPRSSQNVWNRMEYRALEGFVYAVTPFNFTAIAGNLTTAPAMMGNTIVWKPAATAVLSGYYLMSLFREAGLPDGVINFIPADGIEAAQVALASPHLAGIHFTGSTTVFNALWATVAANIGTYKSYPRIVGETGGKDYIFVHPTASLPEVAVAIVRGSFEYQGQKCSASSRVYIPRSAWPVVQEDVVRMVKDLRMGDTRDFRNFINAVIDEKAFDRTMAYIGRAKESADVEVLVGGHGDKAVGYFIEPTVLVTSNPSSETMCEELFAPVVTVYVYDDDKVAETVTLLSETSPYALTGAIFAQDRFIIQELTHALADTAGNFYVNDKPTGAVVGQQPFGGARASGTNDKAGSYLNLVRWASPRTIKETFVAGTDHRYPFMDEA